MKAMNLGLWSIVLCLAILAPSLRANIADFDDYWQQRADEARTAALETYVPEPEEITDHLNLHVHKALEGKNSTRRGLGKYSGPCEKTNPIDRCWRCKKDWASNRKRLAKCVLGFGRKTTGGVDGEFYVVTDPSDDDLVNPKPGTLRHAVTRDEPLWITFSGSMIITLQKELLVTSHKTIDGRGANVHIANGAGITIQYVKNVIIHGLHIHDISESTGGEIRDSAHHVGLRTDADGDGISIFGSSNVWIDHVSMSYGKDGLVDIIMGSTGITISNSHFTHHNEVMLFGANDSHTIDSIMQVTVAFNHFGRGLVQRMPRCRWGLCHVVNNDYTHWLMYAVGGSTGPTIISQGNRYIAPPNADAKQVTKRENTPESVWKSWTWKTEGDLMMNGAFFVESGPKFNKKKYQKKDLLKAKPGTFAARLTRFSGALNCVVKQKC